MPFLHHMRALRHWLCCASFPSRATSLPFARIRTRSEKSNANHMSWYRISASFSAYEFTYLTKRTSRSHLGCSRRKAFCIKKKKRLKWNHFPCLSPSGGRGVGACVYVHHSFFTILRLNWSFVGHSSSSELPRGGAILVGKALPCAAEQDMVFKEIQLHYLASWTAASFCELEAFDKVGDERSARVTNNLFYLIAWP